MDVEIIFYVESKVSMNIFENLPVYEWRVLEIAANLVDFIVIASVYYNEIFEKLTSLNNWDLIKGKCIKYDDFFEYLFRNQLQPYKFPYWSVYTKEGLEFVFQRGDLIGEQTMLHKKVYAFNDIDLFFELVEKYYHRMDDGIFLDCGANIGTTALYVKKHFVDLKVIGFEPSSKNYNLFRVNKILNGMEDVEINHCALSDVNGEANFSYNIGNSGGSSINENGDEIVKVITLDSYLKSELVEQVKYLWIDTEGYDSKVVLGAKNMLRTKKIPLCQEFQPLPYKNNGSWDEYVNFVQEIYDSFIDMEHPERGCIPIDGIDRFSAQMKNDNRLFTNLFFC